MGQSNSANFDAYAKTIRQRESSGDYTQVNQFGYTGAYQFGKPALIDAGFMDKGGNWTDYARSLGVNSWDSFKNNPQAQDIAFQNFTEKNWDYLRSYLPHVGQTVAGVPITVSGMLAGAHLVGAGAVKEFLDSGGTIVRPDGNGVPITDYMRQFGGHNFLFDTDRKRFGGAVDGLPGDPIPGASSPGASSLSYAPIGDRAAHSPVPYLTQTQSAEPAFGATGWPPRSSAKMLSPDAARPFAGAPRVAPVPFVDEAMKARQSLDNALPAAGAAPWALSNRFGTWDTIGGVSGPVRSGGSSAPASPPASPPMRPGRADSNQPSPGVITTGALPIPQLAPTPQNKPGGLLGKIIDAGYIDPTNPDPPPAGGLAGLLQDYLHNNPGAGG
jgi:hypothetical protein